MIQMEIPPRTSCRCFYKLTASNIGDQVFYTSLLAQLGEKTRPVALHLDASGFNQSRNLVSLSQRTTNYEYNTQNHKIAQTNESTSAISKEAAQQQKPEGKNIPKNNRTELTYPD
jgi:hypothetical protein